MLSLGGIGIGFWLGRVSSRARTISEGLLGELEDGESRSWHCLDAVETISFSIAEFELSVALIMGVVGFVGLSLVYGGDWVDVVLKMCKDFALDDLFRESSWNAVFVSICCLMIGIGFLVVLSWLVLLGWSYYLQHRRGS